MTAGVTRYFIPSSTRLKNSHTSLQILLKAKHNSQDDLFPLKKWSVLQDNLKFTLINLLCITVFSSLLQSIFS